MCFFDQNIYECGDSKWGPFRQNCAKEYRTGETCGMRFVMNKIALVGKCRICNKLEIKYERVAKEEERIRRWKAQGAKLRKASIEVSEDTIECLKRDIDKLVAERRSRTVSLGGCATEAYNEDRRRKTMCVPGVIDLATGCRPNDSEGGRISEGSFYLKEALLPWPSPVSWTESLSVRVEEVAPFNHTNQLANNQSNLCKSQKGDIEVRGGDFSFGPHPGVKCNRQETLIPPTDKDAGAGTDTSAASNSSRLLDPEEENPKYFLHKTRLKSYMPTHYITNAGVAVPKTSRRRANTLEERQRVANTRKYKDCKDCKAREITVCVTIAVKHLSSC